MRVPARRRAPQLCPDCRGGWFLGAMRYTGERGRLNLTTAAAPARAGDADQPEDRAEVTNALDGLSADAPALSPEDLAAAWRPELDRRGARAGRSADGRRPRGHRRDSRAPAKRQVKRPGSRRPPSSSSKTRRAASSARVPVGATSSTTRCWRQSSASRSMSRLADLRRARARAPVRARSLPLHRGLRRDRRRDPDL